MGRDVSRWAEHGTHVEIGGRSIFTWEQGAGPPMLAIHGFPSSSYDWWPLADLIGDRRFVAFDLPGFGLSDKSATASYSIFDYADIATEVAVRRGLRSFDLIAHDLGDTVAAELLARANEDRLPFTIERVVLLNGSIFIDMAKLTSGQKLFLKMKPRRLSIPPPVRMFRPQMRRTFARVHKPSGGKLRAMEALLKHDGGHRMLPLTIRYIEERRKHQERWTDALVDFAGPITLIWGDRDPVAVPAMADRLVGLRPSAYQVRWSDVGHWPHLEVPDRLADKLGRVLA